MNPKVWAVVLGVSYFGFCLGAVPQTNVGYGDSDGFIAAGYTWGLMHPPGYPLYITLLHGWMKLMPWGSIAFKAHLLSTLFHSLTLGVLFLATFELIGLVRKPRANSQTGTDFWLQLWVSILAAAMLGLNLLFFQNSIVAEKYALNNLLAAIWWWWGLRLWRRPITQSGWGWLGVSVGLGVMHHQTIVLLAPMLGLSMVLSKQKPAWRRLSIGLMSGVAVSLVLLGWINTRPGPVNWHFETNVRSLAHQLMRSEIAGLDDKSGIIRNLYALPFSWALIQHQLSAKLTVMGSHFGREGLGAALVGTWLIWRLKGKYRWVVLAGTFLTLWGLPWYTPWPETVGSQALVVRWWLLGYIALPTAVGLALWRGVETLLNNGVKTHQVRWLITGLGAGWVIWRGITNYPQVRLDRFNSIQNTYAQVLGALPKDSLIVCDSDTSCFALLYLQSVEVMRPDVYVIPPGYPLVADRLQTLTNGHGMLYRDNPFLLVDYVTWNMGKRRVFAIDLHPTHRNLLGMQYGITRYVPHGVYGEIVKDSGQATTADVPEVTMSKIEVPAWDLMRQYFDVNTRYNQGLNAAAYSRLGQDERAGQELALARSEHNPVELENWLNQVAEEAITPPPEYLPKGKKLTVEAVMAEARFRMEAGDYKQAYFGFLGATLMEPIHETARMELAHFYELAGEREMAEIEYQNVLKYYPESRLARERLEYVSDHELTKMFDGRQWTFE